jgi:DNA (cytosine-5)-methyltransferase 1
MENNFLLGELFCGPGGMALAAKIAAPQISINGDSYRISHLWGVDKDPEAIQTYNVNNLGEGVLCDALDFTLNEKRKGNKVISDFKKIDALAFGFPCNDFSLVGEKRGFQGKFGNLYKAGLYAIEHANPKWFIAENVSGIHSADSGKAFKKILSELEVAGQYGYELSVHLYKFEDYGVPQYRHRYLIVGIRKDLNLKFQIPSPTHLNNHITVKDALSKSYDEHITNTRITRQSANVIDRLFFTPPWHNAWFLDELVEMNNNQRRNALKLAPWYDSDIKNLSDEEILKRIKTCKLNCKSARMSHIYKRLHADKASYTITGSGGGGTHVYHWEESRALTNRERARLQGFPDDFEFKGSKEQVRKQIGMAVPPFGAKIIFEAILKTFAGISYDTVNASFKYEGESTL